MRTITVKGVGTASTTPDYIEISMNIKSEDNDYEVAVNEANHRIEVLQSTIENCGLAKETLKTLSFEVSTKYENIRHANGTYTSVFKGYECVYRMKLGFDFDSQVLSKVLTAISQEHSIKAELSVKFTVKDPTAIKDELLRSAAENARHKAEILCTAMDAQLGVLNEIDYNWGEINIYSRTTFKESLEDDCCYLTPLAATPEFTPDDIKSSDTATFVWEIK